jgi:uncharacterized phage-associated protein
MTASDAQPAQDDELRDVLSGVLSCAHGRWIGRTMLVKLVYFSELESWRRDGRPLTGTNFYRWQFGAWAPDVPSMAERLSDRIEHRHIMQFYPTHEYRLRGGAPIPKLSPRALEILRDVCERYARLSASVIGSMSKATEPMLVAPEMGQTLDLSIVAPPKPSLRINHSALARAQAAHDRSVRGSADEIANRDISEVQGWLARRRTATG